MITAPPSPLSVSLLGKRRGENNDKDAEDFMEAKRESREANVTKCRGEGVKVKINGLSSERKRGKDSGEVVVEGRGKRGREKGRKQKVYSKGLLSEVTWGERREGKK